MCGLEGEQTQMKKKTYFAGHGIKSDKGIGHEKFRNLKLKFLKKKKPKKF